MVDTDTDCTADGGHTIRLVAAVARLPVDEPLTETTWDDLVDLGQQAKREHDEMRAAIERLSVTPDDVRSALAEYLAALDSERELRNAALDAVRAKDPRSRGLMAESAMAAERAVAAEAVLRQIAGAT